MGIVIFEPVRGDRVAINSAFVRAVRPDGAVEHYSEIELDNGKKLAVKGNLTTTVAKLNK